MVWTGHAHVYHIPVQMIANVCAVLGLADTMSHTLDNTTLNVAFAVLWHAQRPGLYCHVTVAYVRCLEGSTR